MKERNKLPNIKILYSYFKYDHGKLYWKKTNSNRAKLGEEAGMTAVHRYKKVRLFGVDYYAHRVIYKMFFNEEPDYIDHIDGNTMNNHVHNLQAISNSENVIKSKKIRVDNTSGHKNISIDKDYNGTGETRFIVRIQRNNKMNHHGVFNCIHEAINARDKVIYGKS